jgi:hypothetical protein
MVGNQRSGSTASDTDRRLGKSRRSVNTSTHDASRFAIRRAYDLRGLMTATGSSLTASGREGSANRRRH